MSIFKNLFFVTLLLSFSTYNTLAQDQILAREKSQAFATALTTGAYEEAATFFAPKLAAQLNAQKLEELWGQLLAQLKAFESMGTVTAVLEDNTPVTYQPLQFETSLLDLKLAYNADMKLIGMVFVPHKVFELELIDTKHFYEEEILVGEGSEFELPGILTIPKHKKKVPAIILVHGSGPNDMDETVGPNKLFRDLAHELALHGIAVLRYEKRTRTYGGSPKLDINTLTLYEETIEDAIIAVDLAAKHKR